MVTYDDFLQNCYDLADDNTAATQVLIARFGNEGYRRAMRLFNRQLEERTKTTLTVASQQYYQLPVDYTFMKSVTVTVGTQAYPLEEVAGQREWNDLNRMSNITGNRPTKFFVRQNLGQGGDEVGVWPTPSSAGNTVTLVYNAVPRTLGNSAFSSGTVTVSNGSQTVTSSNSSFTQPLVGRYLKLADSVGDGNFYKVSNYVSSSSLTLQNYYEGSSVAGASFGVYELFALPEEAQNVPVYYALWHYYLMRQNKEQTAIYKGLHDEEMDKARKNQASKSMDSVVRRSSGNLPLPDYPLWFPTNATSNP